MLSCGRRRGGNIGCRHQSYANQRGGQGHRQHQWWHYSCLGFVVVSIYPEVYFRLQTLAPRKLNTCLSYLYEVYRVIVRAPHSPPSTGSIQMTLFLHTGKTTPPTPSPGLPRMSKGCCHPQHSAASTTSLGCLSQAIPSKALNKHNARS